MLKRKVQTLFILSLVLIFLFISLINFKPVLLSNPFNRSLNINYPSFVTADGDSNMYIIDDSRRRIIKASPEGKVLTITKGGIRQSGHFYSAIEVACTDDGSFYLLNRVPDREGFYTVKEEVLKYSSKGKFLSVIFSREYQESDRRPQLVQRGQLSGLKFNTKQNRVEWFDNGPDGVHHYYYGLNSQSISFDLAIPVKNANIEISSITSAGDTYYYISKKGKLLLYQKEKTKEIFNGNEHVENGFPAVLWQLDSNVSGELFFSDILAGKIYRLNVDDPENKVTIILSTDVLKANKLPDDYYPYYRFSIGLDKNIYTCQDTNVIGITAEGKITGYRSSLLLPFTRTTSRLFVQVLTLIAIVSSFYLFKVCYEEILNKKLSLIIKQIIIFVPLVIIALIITSNIVYNNMSHRYQKEIMEKLSMMVQTVTYSVDSELISQIKSPEDFMSPSYKNLRSTLHEFLNENRDPWNYGYYFALHRVVHGKIFSMMQLNDEVTTLHPFSYLNEPEGPYIKALRGTIETEMSADAWGLWMDAIAPIKNSKGETIALIEIGKDHVSYIQENRSLLRKLMVNVFVVSTVFIIIFTVLNYLLLVTLRTLRNGTNMIADGKWEVKLKPKGNDEITDLTRAFNNMAESIRNYVTEIVDLNNAYHRFVPEQFLEFLHKKNIKEIELGDQTQEMMSVMFSDIRSFTTLSESMSPKENFDFLNTYLGLVGPEVRTHNGFIDKYIGDAVMALFPTNSDHALNAAIAIFRKIQIFNEQRELEGLNPINAGFGIHTGVLMLGILGEEKRVDSTVISDSVNLASRLEGLTKLFGASIIISQDTCDLLEHRDHYTMRFLGQVQVKGKKQDVGIYEVLDCLSEEEKILKIKTKEFLESGLEELLDKNITRARILFSKAYKIDSSDLALIFYLKLCTRFEKHPSLIEKGIVITEK